VSAPGATPRETALGAPAAALVGSRARAERRAVHARRVVVAAVAALVVVLAAAFFAGAERFGGPAAPAAEPAPAALTPADAAAARSVVARARALVAVTPAQLGYRLRVAGRVAGLRGRTDTAARTITLYVAPGDAPGAVAHDLGHELGHAFDATRLTDADRAAYLRARGVPGATWFPGGRASDYHSGAGDFAEVFALCHAASTVYRSRLAARPQDPCGVLPKQARAAKLGDGGS
jgi:hypothetical protein